MTLIERLKSAMAPSFELDGEIAKAFGFMPDDASFVTKDAYGSCEPKWVGGGYGAYVFYDPESYTSSLDAALALVEAKLPGMHWRVERTCEHPGLAFRTHRFTGWVGDYGSPARAEGPTPALALCIALLTALEAHNLSSKTGDDSNL